MTEELIEVARRATRCREWRWMSGMLAVDIDGPEGPSFVRVDFVSDGALGHACGLVDQDASLPDLNDPATRGCLLSLVREAWRCETIYARMSSTTRASDGRPAWEVCGLWLDAVACRRLGIKREGSVGCWGHASEVEALVFALEHAP